MSFYEDNGEVSDHSFKREIYTTKYKAIAQLVAQLDSTLNDMDYRFHSLPNSNEHHAIAYYAARTQIISFKEFLKEQQHEAYREYVQATRGDGT